eukprot:9385177-Pyramimonas_sp.AAC.1
MSRVFMLPMDLPVTRDPLEGSAQVLQEHWAQVFSPKALDKTLWPEISEHIQKIPEQLPTEWQQTHAQFFEYLRKRRRSMPGPDGIPYRAWAAPAAARALRHLPLRL